MTAAATTLLKTMIDPNTPASVPVRAAESNTQSHGHPRLPTTTSCIGPNPSRTGSPSAIRMTLTPRTHSSGAISGQPFPNRAPGGFAPFTRWIPAARSGLKRPQSDASLASRRTAARRTLIVDGAGFLCSSEKRFRAVWLCILSATSHICGLLRGERQYETATRGDKIAVFRSLK